MNLTETDREWLLFACIENMWYGKMKKLLGYFGTPHNILNSTKEIIMKAGIKDEKDAYRISHAKQHMDIDNIAYNMEKQKINFTYTGHGDYPPYLNIYEDKPCILFYKGKLPDEHKRVSVIGARNCTNYGKEMAMDITRKLGKYKVSVVSGMARGIDAYSHRGALEAGGTTYAVLGCGADVCYPRENIELYTKICENGGIISEYPPGSMPDKWKFPLRNRLISMFSDGVLVVEAKEKSGTLITVDYALKQGKEVFAVPGRANDILSKGCLKLIKSGAMPVTEAEDMLYCLGIQPDSERGKKSQISNMGLEKENEVLYSCLDLFPMSIEEIIQKTGMNQEDVYRILVELTVMGLVTEPFKNHFARKL